jgi:hypothetical protein
MLETARKHSKNDARLQITTSMTGEAIPSLSLHLGEHLLGFEETDIRIQSWAIRKLAMAIVRVCLCIC